MDDISRIIRWKQGDDMKEIVGREWLLTNGLGGYAFGTISGVLTRKQHGMLVSALPSPLGRVVMLSHILEKAALPNGAIHELGGIERREGDLYVPGAECLSEFALHIGLPVWLYRIGDFEIEKRVLLPRMQNTVYVQYRLIRGEGKVVIRLFPMLFFRPHNNDVTNDPPESYSVEAVGSHYLIRSGSELPDLKLLLYGSEGSFSLMGGEFLEVFYRIERDRGYPCQGMLWMPGYFQVTISKESSAALAASTESWEVLHALSPSNAFRSETYRRRQLLNSVPLCDRAQSASELVLAADQFIIAPVTRTRDVVRAHATGDEVRSVIAGYPWFTDWGRDTMISLEGLTIVTGRCQEAGYILRTFGRHVHEGIIPNLFPEGEEAGLYHTADATLWFFHAVERYLAATKDVSTLRHLLPGLKGIIDHHMRGTRFGIGMDPGDGLLTQGDRSFPLTWMDAKVGNWIVTPRRGKAVEINALWFNALSLFHEWIRGEEGEGAARPIRDMIERIYESFNRRFWNQERGCLYDVIDGENGSDASIRPNQLLAISLTHPVLDPVRWRSVFDVVTRQLLTPVGLRTLSPDHREYKSRYLGDLRARDAAYHQGTVWPWLLGPYIDAWLKVDPDKGREAAHQFLGVLFSRLNMVCVGSISEVFDGEEPFHPGGCPAQAWSVAEVLRAWVKTVPRSADSRPGKERQN